MAGTPIGISRINSPSELKQTSSSFHRGRKVKSICRTTPSLQRSNLIVDDLDVHVHWLLMAGHRLMAIRSARLSMVTQQLRQLFQSGQEVIRTNCTIALRA